jgi:hypothetical protein
MRVLLLALAMFGCVADVSGTAGGDEPDGGADIGDGDPTPNVAGCTAMTTVVLYSEETSFLTLPNAFAAAADPCTRYYVDIPPLAADKTQPRMGADKVHALGPNFFAMAEFSWSGWHDWVAASPGTRDWRLAGQAFRTRMAAAGYDVSRGDIWSINEFPTTTRAGTDDVWTHEESAVRGLAEGDGTMTVRGVVYLAGMGQTLQNFSVYKPSVEGWLAQTAFWSAMNSYVKWFSYEVYADPHDDCVPGSNVVSDAANLNAYLEHIPRLAVAGGSRTATAASYLKHHYLPLVNEAWNSNVGFGDNVVGLDDFIKFSRLQIFATHFWAANHGYPGRRIGFAWAPKNSTPGDDAELTTAIANSVARAYPKNKFFNLGKYACSTSGNLDGCGCTITGSYNTAWNTFSTW